MAKPSPSFKGNKELSQLGKAIRALRVNAGYSQEGFGDTAGLDRSYLGGIERGEHNLAVINTLKISKALKIKTSELFKLAGL